MASRLRPCSRRRYLVVMAGLLALLAATAKEARAQVPINTMCPVMTLEEVDPTVTIVYRGKTVAFCCDNCVKKFLANPERYASRLAAFAEDAGDETDPGDDPSDSDHDPSEDASDHKGGLGEAEAKMPWLARLHPVVVHFPLAGVPMAMAALLGWFTTRRKLFVFADVPPLILAAVASVVAVITGNMAHDSMRFSKSMHDYVEWHEWAATTLMILLLILSTLRLWRWRRLNGKWLVLYTGGLVAASCLVGLVGFLGGTLVFGIDHLLP